MCAVSFVGDHYAEKWQRYHWIPNVSPNTPPSHTVTLTPNLVGREEFEKLKAEVADMKELLKRAKAYDEATGQPDCERAEKVDLLRRVAKLVGVDLGDVLTKAAGAA